MAIEKVKLLGIKGDTTELDKFIANVLFQSDVQIEDVKKIYEKAWKLEYYEYDYRIKENLKKCESLLDKAGVKYTKQFSEGLVENSIEEIASKIDEINTQFEENIKIINDNVKQNEATLEEINKISKLENLNIDMKKLYDLQYIKFRYGSIPKKSLQEIKDELDSLNTIWFEISEEKDICWIMYFTTVEYAKSIDGLFNIQKFEREPLPRELEKTPKEYIRFLNKKIKSREEKNIEISNNLEKIQKQIETTVLGLYRELQIYDKINTLKKYIAHDQNDTFYIVVWVPEKNLIKMEAKIKQFDGMDFVVRERRESTYKIKK